MCNKLDKLNRAWTKFEIGLQQIVAIVEADIRRLRHDPYEIFTRLVQPVIWLLIFGQAMANVRAIPTGNEPYLDFIAPGILAQSILFMSIFYGINIILDKDSGVLAKLLVSPAPRLFLVFGRALAAGIRGLTQAIIIYILCFFIGVDLRLDFLSMVGMFFIIMLGGGLFSTLALILAVLVKRRDRYIGIGQLFTMPLFFASNALYPIQIMPEWIRTLSSLNPLTYQVDALRTFMVGGESSHFGIGVDFAVCGSVFCVLLAIATKVYPKILY